MAWTYEPQKISSRGKTGEMSCEILQQRRERSVIGGVKLRLVEMTSHDQLIANTQNVSPASVHELRSTNQPLCLNNLLICSTPPCRSTRKITAQTMTSQYGQVAFSTKTALTTNHRQTFHSWKTAVLGNWVAAPNRKHTSAHVPEPRSPLLQHKNTTSLRHPFPSSQVYTRRHVADTCTKRCESCNASGKNREKAWRGDFSLNSACYTMVQTVEQRAQGRWPVSLKAKKHKK